MYESSFGLTEAPFSISPDPRYLYMSQRHQEAMAHLRYGIQEAGGFVQLTGEVGTGKTTICRCMLEQLPDNVDVALILNPQISNSELLATLCDEIGVTYQPDATPKQLLDLLNERLIESFGQGRRTVLVIDEAQILTRAVLEQIRILTNLETTKQKLLQIILIGQPELNTTISRSDLRQLSQRITARYHLEPLMKHETAEYIRYRLEVAGCRRQVFTRGAMRQVHRLSRGVPRLINVLCDRALLGAYSSDSNTVTASMVRKAGREVFGNQHTDQPGTRWWIPGLGAAAILAAVVVLRPEWIAFDPPAVRTLPPVSGSEQLDPAPGTEKPDPRVDQRSDGGGDTPGPVVAQSDTAAAEAVATPEPAAAAAPLPSIEFLLDGDDVARDEPEALSELLGVWGLDPEGNGEVSCETIEATHGLRCLNDRGTWEELRTFNRVAALLLERQGETAYVVLNAMHGDDVTISTRSGVYRLPRSRVDERWSGEYVLLWRAPPEGTRTIAENSEGVDVLWLRQTLNRVPSLEPSDVENAHFDAVLKEKIMTFQRSNNLQVDGRAGPRTIIRLNSIVDPDVPKLQSMSAG